MSAIILHFAILAFFCLPSFLLLRFRRNWHLKTVQTDRGGVSRKWDILLKTPPRAKLKKGGVWGGLKGAFRCAEVLSA